LQHLQGFNPGKINEQFIHGLQPYLSSSKGELLRIKALMIISSSVEEIASDFFELTTEDMELLKSQLSHARDFSSKEVLELLLTMSHLSQNLRVMSSTELLDPLSQILDGDKNEAEQDIAAQLITSIVEFEASTKEKMKEVLANSHNNVYVLYMLL
jgi:hypothetical protein